MMKQYLFDWKATHPNKYREGKITVTSYCYSAAEAEAIHRVKNEWNYQECNVSVDLRDTKES